MYIVFDYSMSVFQATPYQNVRNIVGSVPNSNVAAFSSVQTCQCLHTQVLQNHIPEVTGCLLAVSEYFVVEVSVFSSWGTLADTQA
jgi:hypothetical protein